MEKVDHLLLNCFITVMLFFFILQYWAFSDIQTGRVLTKVTDESAGCGKYLYVNLCVWQSK